MESIRDAAFLATMRTGVNELADNLRQTSPLIKSITETDEEKTVFMATAYAFVEGIMFSDPEKPRNTHTLGADLATLQNNPIYLERLGLVAESAWNSNKCKGDLTPLRQALVDGIILGRYKGQNDREAILYMLTQTAPELWGDNIMYTIVDGELVLLDGYDPDGLIAYVNINHYGDPTAKQYASGERIPGPCVLR